MNGNIVQRCPVMRGTRLIVMVGMIFVSAGSAGSRASAETRVGFGEAEITPDLAAPKSVWLAGYGMGRKAIGIHDPLMARSVVLEQDGRKIALISLDLVGLQYPAVKQIRAALPDYHYVMVSSTHNHEGPDVIGIWGPSPFQSGVDPAYLERVIERSVDAVRTAERQLVAAEARYGTAEDESLVDDSRLPIVKDGILRVVRFQTGDRLIGLLVQWNCHPEAMGSRNQQITADFPAVTVAALRQKYGCPVSYFSGAVGGLMAPPDHGIRAPAGNELREGDFAYMEAYGLAVARLASQAVEAAEPLALNPLRVVAKPVAVPVENRLYRAAREIGVLRRDAFVWAGDADTIGPPFAEGEATPESRLCLESEVAYLRLGDLHIACIPGELYPELVYGQFQEPPEAATDFPDAPKEPVVCEVLPGEKWLLFGLANDEVGYILPKRQWDLAPPFAYGRNKPQYGEVNSCGPDTGPILMRALLDRVRAAAP